MSVAIWLKPGWRWSWKEKVCSFFSLLRRFSEKAADFVWCQVKLEGNRATTAIWALEIFGDRSSWKVTGRQSGNLIFWRQVQLEDDNGSRRLVRKLLFFASCLYFVESLVESCFSCYWLSLVAWYGQLRFLREFQSDVLSWLLEGDKAATTIKVEIFGADLTGRRQSYNWELEIFWQQAQLQLRFRQSCNFNLGTRIF